MVLHIANPRRRPRVVVRRPSGQRRRHGTGHRDDPLGHRHVDGLPAGERILAQLVHQDAADLAVCRPEGRPLSEPRVVRTVAVAEGRHLVLLPLSFLVLGWGSLPPGRRLAVASRRPERAPSRPVALFPEATASNEPLPEYIVARGGRFRNGRSTRPRAFSRRPGRSSARARSSSGTGWPPLRVAGSA